jgi:hypothetical protein
MEQDRKMQQDLGLIIEPNLEDEDSGLNPYHCMMDRPHIIYNEKTKGNAD